MSEQIKKVLDTSEGNEKEKFVVCTGEEQMQLHAFLLKLRNKHNFLESKARKINCNDSEYALLKGQLANIRDSSNKNSVIINELESMRKYVCKEIFYNRVILAIFMLTIILYIKISVMDLNGTIGDFLQFLMMSMNVPE